MAASFGVLLRCLARPFQILISSSARGSDRNENEKDRKQYLDHASTLYPDATEMTPVQYQGGCSYTLLVSQRGSNTPEKRQDVILQFRPVQYALDLDLAKRAREIYGELAPITRSRGRLRRNGPRASCQVLEMGVVPGVRLSQVLPRSKELSKQDVKKLRYLLDNLASFFLAGIAASDIRRRCTGKVGTSIVDRLAKLAKELPTASLRLRAKESLKAVRAGAWERLPVLLTHGDLLPSNIMIDAETWKLNGLVDWAESEDLPFGLALYAVEHVLGYLDVREDGGSEWVWYEQARVLREFFESRLRESLASAISEVDVRVARDVGVLLWHGFAWDDGKIDRVVNEEDDALELLYLRAFLE